MISLTCSLCFFFNWREYAQIFELLSSEIRIFLNYEAIYKRKRWISTMGNLVNVCIPIFLK